MTPKQFAKKLALELRKHPERWGQTFFATDAHGVFTSPSSPTAVCWCLTGFIRRDIAPEGLVSIQTPHAKAIADVLGIKPESRAYGGIEPPSYPGVVRWNDDPQRTVGEVIAMLDKVAEAA